MSLQEKFKNIFGDLSVLKKIIFIIVPLSVLTGIVFIIPYTSLFSTILDFLFPEDKYELRKITRIASIVIAITSFIFFLIFFKIVLCVRRRGRGRDVDFKILATLGFLSLIPPFLPELTLNISEIGNVKIKQADKDNFRDKFRYYKELNSVNNIKNKKDGNFEALTFFLPIMMEVIIEEDNKKKVELLCEALEVTGVPSPEQVRFYERSRSSPFTENTYLYFGLPMEEKEAKKLFEREDYGTLKNFNERRATLEKIVRAKCNKNIFEIKGLIQRLKICIESFGKSSSSIKEKRIALNEIISAFKEKEEVLKKTPGYFTLIGQHYYQLAETYDKNSSLSQIREAQKYYLYGINEISEPENYYSNFVYAEFLVNSEERWSHKFGQGVKLRFMIKGGSWK